ncbi:MAG: TetR/AcrR family transcriptional regulator [Mariprofundaceae bacterium]|nr:TetR/AcrR family transcriptional regulator [Mariprofundaceae bacterium]
MHTDSKADTTRQTILQVAAEEIHLYGFQACKISQIIQKAGISKGALYHHFPSKLELGYAVLDEILSPYVTKRWQPILSSPDPIQSMTQFFQEAMHEVSCECISKGCPLNNLAQEMSPIDEGFRLRLNHMMRLWQQDIEKALQRGQANGLIDPKVNAEQSAIFIIAAIEGAHGLAKSAQDVGIFAKCLNGLIDYLKRLQPAI